MRTTTSAAAVAAVLLLAGCGGGGGTTKQASPKPSPSPSAFATGDFCAKADPAAVKAITGTTLAFHPKGKEFEALKGFPVTPEGDYCLAYGASGSLDLYVYDDPAKGEPILERTKSGRANPEMDCAPQTAPDGFPEGSAAATCKAKKAAAFPIPDNYLAVGRLGDTVLTCNVSAGFAKGRKAILSPQAASFCSDLAEALAAR